MSNQPKIGCDKIVIGTSDPTFFPMDATPNGTAVVNGPLVCGLPFGASPVGGLVPRATVMIGPPIAGGLSSLLGGKPPLATPNSMEVNGLSLFVGVRQNVGLNLKFGLTQTNGLKADVGTHTHAGVKSQTGASISTGFKIGIERIIGVGGVTGVGQVLGIGGVVDGSGNVLSAKKNFDIPHPTKQGWRLAHSCVEGPEAAVYVRGKTQEKTIQLPEYWTGLVDESSITVSLTPIGKYQELYVKTVTDNKIEIGCDQETCEYYYHVWGERKDTEKLIPEYEGSIEDYPGDNSQRSIVGYHYDVRNETT